VGATYEVEVKPSDPTLGFGAEAEPFENPFLTLNTNSMMKKMEPCYHNLRPCPGPESL
jgi:hypothetical protein